MAIRFTRVAAAAAVSAVLFGAGGAFAGSCPAESVLTMPREIIDAPDVGVTRDILSAVELRGWRGLGDFLLRTLRVEQAHADWNQSA